MIIRIDHKCTSPGLSDGTSSTNSYARRQMFSALHLSLHSNSLGCAHHGPSCKVKANIVKSADTGAIQLGFFALLVLGVLSPLPECPVEECPLVLDVVANVCGGPRTVPFRKYPHFFCYSRRTRGTFTGPSLQATIGFASPSLLIRNICSLHLRALLYVSLHSPILFRIFTVRWRHVSMSTPPAELHELLEPRVPRFFAHNLGVPFKSDVLQESRPLPPYLLQTLFLGPSNLMAPLPQALSIPRIET
mmetsp:Transcript_20442/g.59198  ORF Transcript_20442/g.59198 Transcript_20442/m.59198 type:complete len:247 (-) Transcript_20442:1652-2392(-)